ncbi:glycosyltransferase family 2 protein [Salmonirosea aquatica]|uniref:Glycosyltransferase n=1 Tax=Salmonirosea aquatica TaxID=2654236 RepID=A0A7C9BFS3_9BACT|nr:glycosyltransferase [Cytophagaceae bacterium SJW1-29]
MPLVSIITVNFNQPVVTEEFLNSVRTVNGYPDIEVIVVDNGSSHNWTPDWRVRFPDVIFIRSEKNLGFAGGNNLGLRVAQGNYYFLINNDTEFTPRALGKLVAILDQYPEVGMVSPRLHYFEDRNLIQYAGYTPLNYRTGRNRCVGQYEHDRGQYDGQCGPTGYVHGAAMLVRKEAVEKAGPMDPHYFLYFEELDWCERIKKAGYKAYVDLDAVIYHKESVSVGKRSALKEYFMTRNRILFLRKHAPPLSFALFCAYFTLAVVPRNVLRYLRNREYNFIGVFFKAIRWHFTHSSDSPELGYSL